MLGLLTPRASSATQEANQEGEPKSKGVAATLLRKLSFGRKKDRKKKAQPPPSEENDPGNSDTSARSEVAGAVTLEHVASLQVQLDRGLSDSSLSLNSLISPTDGATHRGGANEAKELMSTEEATTTEVVVEVEAEADADAQADADAKEADEQAARSAAAAAYAACVAATAAAEAAAAAAKAEAAAEAEAEAAAAAEAARMEQERVTMSFDLVQRVISAATAEAERIRALERERAISATSYEITRKALTEALAIDERDRISSDFVNQAILAGLRQFEREVAQERELIGALVVERAVTMALTQLEERQDEPEQMLQDELIEEQSLPPTASPVVSHLHETLAAETLGRSQECLAETQQVPNGNFCVALQACFAITSTHNKVA